jgi:1A family penicillin-binding protein
MPRDRQRIGAHPLLTILRSLGSPLFGLFLFAFICLIAGLLFAHRLLQKLAAYSSQFKLSAPKISLPRLHPPSFRFFPALPLFLLFFSAAGIFSFYWLIVKDLPPPASLLDYRPPVTTRLYAKDGRLLYSVYEDQNRTLVSLTDVPKEAIYAILAIEDSQFYQHIGFSPKGILRAAFNNLDTDSLQGGSTITQQLVKNTLLTPERTFTRKLKELVLSIALETHFTKDEILSMYLNQVGFGGTAYGIEAAAQSYFGKSIQDVNLAEAALLAGLPRAPTLYSPFGTNPEAAIARQHEVLNRMVDEDYISAEMADAAKQYPLKFISPAHNIQAPHFVMYVKDYLVSRYGETVVNQGGLQVTTSLDLNIQALAQTVVVEELDKLQKLNVQNAAVLVTKPATGEILAMVGSKNYFDTQKDGQVNVTLRERQPGSSIKAITYTLALENGFTPTTILEDSPVTYNLPGSPPYSPKNYDGQYHGKVPLRIAFASSYNIPAVKTLAQLGVSQMIQKAQAMGITTWTDPSRYGLSLTLGGGEVKMVDLAVAYGTLANLGTKVPLNPLLKITDYTHAYDYDYACNTHVGWNSAQAAADNPTLCPGDMVIDPQVAYLVTDILKDNRARTPAFGAHSLLNIEGYDVAVKTGTTNSLRDNWTIGYTPDYLVAVWVGNNDNTPMSRIASGVTGASSIWNRVMTSLLTHSDKRAFTPPPGLVTVTVCGLTGQKTCGACPNPRAEYFKAGTEPTSTCTDEQIQKLLTPTQSPEPPRDQILQGITTIQPTPTPFKFEINLPFRRPPKKPRPTR